MTAPRMLVWADENQIDVIRQAAQCANVVLTAVGSPCLKSAATLQQALGCGRIDDVRAAVHRDDFELLWVAASQPISLDAWRVLDGLGVRSVSLQPASGSIADL